MLTEAQQEIRRTRISGTDIGAIVGVNPYKTKLDVYMDKKGLSKPFEGNKYTEWGTNLEPVIRHHFMKNHEEYDFVTTFDSTTLVSPELPFVCGTPDGILWKQEDGEKARVAGLEIKTAGFRNVEKWGKEGTDLVPEQYLVQCQWYMLLTGMQYWHLAVLFGGNTYQEYLIDRDEELIDTLVGRAVEFIKNNLSTDTPPEPTNDKELISYTAAKYSTANHSDELVEADSETEVWADLLFEAKRDKVAISTRVAELEARIKDKIGEKVGVVGDFGTITWKKTKDKETVDWKSVAESMGEIDQEIIEKNTKTKPGYRRLNWKWSKK